MTDRSRSILRLLSESTPHYTTVERIAEETGAGVRTIHRDLEGLERSLRLRGVRLERRRGYGIRLIDPLPERLADGLGRSVSASPVDTGQRQMVILLHLILTGGWVKLSELAHMMFVSDSTVSTDISALESLMPDDVLIDRHKGTGVRLVAAETSTRLLFLSSFPSLFPTYVVFGDEPVKGDTDDRFLRAWGIRDARKHIRGKIDVAENILGFQLSPSYVGLLYSYLFLLEKRTMAGTVLRELPKYRLNIPEAYGEAAVAMIANDLAAVEATPDIAAAEVAFLSRLLASCETAAPPVSSVVDFIGELAGEVNAMIEHSLSRLEEKEKIWLHDDRVLLNYLRMTVAAAAHRIDLGLPQWRDLGLHAFPGMEDSPEAAVLVSQFLSDLGRTLREPAPGVVRRELQEASLALAARLETYHSRNSTDLWVKILCYEGLGMSNYLLAIAKDTFPRGTSFDCRWEPDFEKTDDSRHYDLIISTYPFYARGMRQLVLNGDDSPAELRHRLRTAAAELEKSGALPGSRGISPEAVGPHDAETSYSLKTVMDVIGGFFVAQCGDGEDPLETTLDSLDRGDCDRAVMEADFLRRESFGSLVFEELGVRLLHCRTEGIPEPRAGVIQYPDPADTVLVLAAPVSAKQSQTHALSEIVIALTEYDDFVGVLATGNRREIQARLMTLFGQSAV